MAAGDRLEGVPEIGEGVYAVHLRRLDERGNAAPALAPFVVAGEERVLAIQGKGPDRVLDGIGVDLDPVVGEKDLQAVPLPGDIAELLAEPGAGGDAGAAAAEPKAEVLDQRCRAGLATARRSSAGRPRTAASMR